MPLFQSCEGGTKRRVRDCLVQRSGVGNACFEPLEEFHVSLAVI